jgi:SAM-dependent methyltransferase
MVNTACEAGGASRLGSLYDRVYAALCGTHPNYRFWHFQYLFLKETHAWQRVRMAGLSGHVLDVGCGHRPYEAWAPKGGNGVTRYTGLDVTPGEGVDVVVGANDVWPIADHSVDCLIFTQVLEHVADRHHVLGQMSRVLKPGGVILLTVPFIFVAHGLPHDYARFTTAGVRALFEDQYDVADEFDTGHPYCKGTVAAVLAALCRPHERPRQSGRPDRPNRRLLRQCRHDRTTKGRLVPCTRSFDAAGACSIPP